MKKLKLKEFAITAQEMLSREQLKTIVGGYGGNSAGCTGGCTGTYSTPNGSRSHAGNCVGDFCICEFSGTGAAISNNTCKKS